LHAPIIAAQSKLSIHNIVRLVWDSTDDRIWVTLQETDEVACIDCATDSVIARVPVGDCPLKLYLNTRHRKLYVLNNDGESVTIVDIAGNQVLRTIPLGNVPLSGWFSPVVDKYYVGTLGAVVVVDGRSDSTVGRLQLPPSDYARAMVGCEGNPFLMLGVYGSQSSVYVVDGVNDSVVATLNVGRGPTAMFWHTDTRRVFCANNFSDDVSVVSDDGSHVETTLGVGDAPVVLAYSPVRARLYVGHLNSGRVYVIRDSLIGIAESKATPRSGWGRLRATPTVFSHQKPVCVSGASDMQTIVVLSQDGRIVKRLRSYDDGGAAKAIWDGTDGTGRDVPPGVYTLVAQGAALAHARVVRLP